MYTLKIEVKKTPLNLLTNEPLGMRMDFDKIKVSQKKKKILVLNKLLSDNRFNSQDTLSEFYLYLKVISTGMSIARTES